MLSNKKQWVINSCRNIAGPKQILLIRKQTQMDMLPLWICVESKPMMLKLQIVEGRGKSEIQE